MVASANFMRKNILITGAPKSGKSTFLDKLIADYSNKFGFLTKEIRKDGIRTGFEMVSHDGGKMMLADVDTVDTHKVGKYFVHTKNIDLFLKKLSSSDSKDLLYIDEIGQMQLFSDLFRKIVLQFLNSPNTCVATITSVYEDDFTRDIKNRADVIVVEITPENREEKLTFAKMLLKKIEKARQYMAEPKRFIFKNNTHALLQSEHGTRELVYTDGNWNCGCDFFFSYKLCSHTIATEAIRKSRNQKV